MAVTLKFFHNAALTSEVTSGNPITASFNSDGSTGSLDRVVYLGSSAASKKFQAASDPGVAQITVTPADSAPGTGHPATEIKLALSLVGLGSAVGGDPLNVGTQILSGSINAIPIYIRLLDSTLAVGSSTELSLATNEVRETAA